MSTAVAIRDPWALIPSLGHLDAYISAVHRLPMLTAEEENRYARQLREQEDLDAAGRLVMSHLRLVVSISRQYLGYGLPQGDLIQEGNVGLMKAVRRFDPDWRLVKVATTKAQRKLFFNLRSLKHSLKTQSAAPQRQALSAAEIDRVAQELNVKPEEVVEMETRMAGADVALEPLEGDDETGPVAPITYLADMGHEPTQVLESRARDVLADDGLRRALDVLDARSRRIVESRWLEVNDDASGGKTLHELAAEYGVSAERIRQIEAAAMKKMRKALVAA